MKRDITNRSDIEVLIDAFYEKVRVNEIIGYIFNDVAMVKWEQHMPTMYAFWAGLLFGEGGYSGNPMLRHVELSKRTAMTEVQFSEWLRLFTETVNELFQGKTADEAKTKAANIAHLMLYKIQTA